VLAGDAVADAVDAAERLGIDMNELAGMLPLIASRWQPRIEGGETTRAEPPQDGADGGARHAEPERNSEAAHALRRNRSISATGCLGRRCAQRAACSGMWNLAHLLCKI
jgi:hypothetical protein